MPIDNRKVLQNIRVPEKRDKNGEVVSARTVLTEKEADTISEMFSQDQLDSFVEGGVLEGDWKSTAKKAETKEPEKK